LKLLTICHICAVATKADQGTVVYWCHPRWRQGV